MRPLRRTVKHNLSNMEGALLCRKKNSIIEHKNSRSTLPAPAVKLYLCLFFPCGIVPNYVTVSVRQFTHPSYVKQACLSVDGLILFFCQNLLHFHRRVSSAGMLMCMVVQILNQLRKFNSIQTALPVAPQIDLLLTVIAPYQSIFFVFD